jgi:hypothetical protein
MDTKNAAPPSLLAEAVGWYGMIAILGAYALSSFDVIGRGPLYHALNLTGAVGVGWICWRKRTWQPFWLEAIWGAVALVALLRALLLA